MGTSLQRSHPRTACPRYVLSRYRHQQETLKLFANAASPYPSLSESLTRLAQDTLAKKVAIKTKPDGWSVYEKRMTSEHSKYEYGGSCRRESFRQTGNKRYPTCRVRNDIERIVADGACIKHNDAVGDEEVGASRRPPTATGVYT